MKNKIQFIRIFLTAVVLLVGGYYIQQSSNHISVNQNSTVGQASADAIIYSAEPDPNAGGGGGGK